MTQKNLVRYSTWKPSRPLSNGAIAYHNAVVNASWHKENIKELIKIVGKKIKNSDIVVDYGAGTGTSSIYLLKYLKTNFKLLLVDNSPSWLTKAYEIFHLNKNVSFFLLEKKVDGYTALDETIGKNSVDHVVSANTVHLIPNIKEAFKGIYAALKNHGTFTFQSGNIIRAPRNRGVLMIDDSVNKIHDIAIEIIRTDKKFNKYKNSLDKRIEKQIQQRIFIFPTPRPIEYYLKILKSVGFKNEKVTYKQIKVKYKDWLRFVRIKRLQAGILPEIGGKDAPRKEEQDRDTIITKASHEFFRKLKKQNPLATARSFTAEWIYVSVEK
ncbi:MAG: methyltransferase domain-containing protein [Patescibacteria group bacterium]